MGNVSTQSATGTSGVCQYTVRLRFLWKISIYNATQILVAHVNTQSDQDKRGKYKYTAHLRH